MQHCKKFTKLLPAICRGRGPLSLGYKLQIKIHESVIYQGNYKTPVFTVLLCVFNILRLAVN